MDYAIELLERERLNMRGMIRDLEFMSDQCQHDFVTADRRERLSVIEATLRTLRSVETTDSAGVSVGEAPPTNESTPALCPHCSSRDVFQSVSNRKVFGCWQCQKTWFA